MAITLTVPLTDLEQARVLEVVHKENPNATGPEVKKWAEQLMKDALKDKIMNLARDQARDAANLAMRQAEADLDEQWLVIQ